MQLHKCDYNNLAVTEKLKAWMSSQLLGRRRRTRMWEVRDVQERRMKDDIKSEKGRGGRT